MTSLEPYPDSYFKSGTLLFGRSKKFTATGDDNHLVGSLNTDHHAHQI